MAVYKLPKAQAKKMLKNQKEITDLSHDITSSVEICPFFITSGSVNLTERGEIAGNLNKNDFTTFQKVFVGGSLITATWLDSTSAQTVFEGNPDTQESGQMVKIYQKGRHFTANLSGESNTTAFEAVVGSEDFLAQKTNTNFNVSILADQWDAMYENMLFIVPEFNLNQWLYLQSWEYERDADPDKPNEVRQINLTFASLQDSISNTGNNVRQFVQRGAPGEAFAWPKIEPDTKAIGLDERYLIDTPITSIQIEFDAPVALSAITVMGRVVNDAETNNVVETPQHLLISRFNSPQTNEITKIGNATPNLYVGKGNLSYEGWTNWLDRFKDAYDEFKSLNFEGYLRIDYSEIVLSNSNVSADQAYYSYQLWADGWTSTAAVAGLYDTQPDYFTGNNITIANGTQMYDVLNHSQFIVSQYLKLPLSIREHTTYAFSSIPLLGTAAKVITGGIPLGWANAQTIVPAQEIPLFIPAEMVNLNAADTASGANDDLIPLDFFRGKDNSDSVGGLLSTNTTFNIELTHLFDRGITTPMENTNELGQLDQDGNKIIWDGTCRALPSGFDSVAQGYILDLISISALGKANAKITAYRGTAKVYEGVIQTKSKYTEEIREWKTDIKCSFWDNPDILSGEQIRYPAAIQPPPQPEGETGIPIITETYNYSSSYAMDGMIGKPAQDGLVYEYDEDKNFTLDLKQYNFTPQDIIDNYSKVRVYYQIQDTGTQFATSIDTGTSILEFNASELANPVVREQQLNETSYYRATRGGVFVEAENYAGITISTGTDSIEIDITNKQTHTGRLDSSGSGTITGVYTNPDTGRPWADAYNGATRNTVVQRMELIP